MKAFKYLPFILPALMLNAHAETIETHVAGAYPGNISNANGSTTKTCVKVVFMTKNTGTLVTGLTAAKLKVISGKKGIFDLTKSAYVTSPVTISHTLTATSDAGVYNLCITPTNFTWTASGLGTPGGQYQFDFLVNGSAAADHGVFLLTLTNN